MAREDQNRQAQNTNTGNRPQAPRPQTPAPTSQESEKAPEGGGRGLLGGLFGGGARNATPPAAQRPATAPEPHAPTPTPAAEPPRPVRTAAPVAEEAQQRQSTIARPPAPKSNKTIIPDGVVIDGSLRSAGETEIAGQINGDVTIQGAFVLDEAGKILGNLKTATCRIEGAIEGKVESQQDIEIGQTGKVNGDLAAVGRVLVSGTVQGNIIAQGGVKLGPTARVTGDLRTRPLVIELGAIFNGHCAMQGNHDAKGEE